MRDSFRMLAFAAAAFCSTGLIAASAMAQSSQGAVEGPESLAPPRIAAAKVTTVSFELFRGNRVTVEATVNGHAAPAILDTGASATTLDRAFAEKIGLPAGRKVQGQGAGGAVEAEIVSGVTLEIGGMRYDNMTVGVMDLAPVAKQLGRDLPIIVGREFFNTAAIEFDWAGQKLTITPSSQYRPQAGATLLPVERRGPFDFVKVSVAGLPAIDALLDLGNGGALKLPSDYWQKQPVLANLRYADSQAGGVGGMKQSRIVTFPTVSFAGTTFSNVPGSMGGDSQGGQPQYGANLGIGILKQFDLVLDLGNNRLVLTPLAKPNFERDRSGLRTVQQGGALEVAFASPQGPAAKAGLKQGDRIVAVDGRPIVADFFATEAGKWNLADAGTPVTLSLADGRTIQLALADFY